MFKDLNNIIEIDLSQFDFSHITTMKNMFNGCTSLKNIIFGNINTSKVENMFFTFCNCIELTSIDLSKFDTHSVKTFERTFSHVEKIKSIDASSFKATNARTIFDMFAYCSELISIKLSNFDTSKVECMQGVFYQSYNIKYLDLGLFDDTKVNNIHFFFAEYSQLLYLNLRSYVTRNNNPENIARAFIMHPSNIKYCIEDLYTKNIIIKDKINDCSDFCFQQNVIFNNEYGECIYNINFTHEFRQQKIISNYIRNFYENNNLYYLDDLIKYIQNSLLHEYNAAHIDNGEDCVDTVGNMSYTMIKTKNIKKQIDEKISTIDLGKCEDKLKYEYKIPKNDSLYILKIDYSIENIRKTEYEIYYNFSLNNFTKLDLSYCKDIKIKISISIDIPVNEIDKYNKSSGLYNDICYKLNNDNGADKPLSLRREQYKKNNISVCEEDCDFTEYIEESKQAICSCYTKMQLPLISQIKIDKKTLFSNFKDIRNIGNFKMMKCLKLFLNKNNILKNSANFILVLLFPLSIMSVIIFVCYDYKIIKKYLYKNTINIKKINNIMLTNNKNPKYNKNKIFNQKSKQKNKKIFKSKIIKKISFSKMKNNTKKGKKLKNRNIYTKNINNYLSNKITFNINLTKKNEFRKYNDYELNQLAYKDAIKIDKRKFIQLYISLLKTKHILIFSFFYLKDYNSYIIKINLFFLTFAMNYVISAMFYSDSTMNKIYVDDGSFDIAYQLPQMFYSFIISSVLGTLLNFLGLYEGDIAEFKKIEKKDKNQRKVLFNIKLKVILFFIIDYILIFFFWIYLGCFCAVYKNTQIHLLLDVTSSFIISFLTPFISNLLPCFLRILSLKDKKGKKYILFKFSNIIQNIL